ncbi:peptide cleavage/export ABC transporter [Ligilactobacillus murinus]|uniref:peptide cleavage/export ABC transporter n=1 Tax=Ligilactobacillus murinus TaxID=1622 RepID=UPI000704CC4F|nr:peptide cleavage/export ABC transporter [Ligilactobacillus murinus]
MRQFYKYYTAQVDEMDCGVACLSMILKCYGTKVSLARLRDLAKTDLEGTTALGLVKAAQKFKLETQAIQADMSLFEVSELSYPFIAHVIKNGALLHYYVILKADEKSILLADPAPDIGVIKMSRENFEKEWSGVALLFTPNDGYNPVKENQRGLLVLFRNLKKQWKLLMKIVSAAMLVTFISILGSYFLQILIDEYIPKKANGILPIIASGLLVVYIFNSMFVYIRDFLLIILGQRLSVEIILGYIRHIFELPMDFFVTRKTGDIVSRFNDANKIVDALASAVISIFLDVGIVLVMGGILAIQNKLLFFVTLICLPIYLIVILAFTKKFEKLNVEQMKSNATLSSSVIEDIKGIETIKALNSENNRYEKINSQFIDFLGKNLAYTKMDLLQQSLKIFVQLSLNVVILWIGAQMVIEEKFTVGQLMAYSALLAYFTGPLQNIINLQPKLQSAQVANNRLNEILFVPTEFGDSCHQLSDDQLEGEITFKDVSYCYGYGQNVLDDINLTIKANEKLAIVGMSGSGKSTLVKMIVNFFEPTSGIITIGRSQVKNVDKHFLRKYINYVSQEPYIFSGSIMENLTLGNKSGVSKKDISEACRLAMIADEIEKMPLQYDTLLDENGNTLSGGQKQRITIARALLSSAKVLIFDESTSGLDTITEKALVDNLLSLEDRTIIFIAHRLAIAKRTDNILVMDSGRIVEYGNHEELLNKGGYYANLVNS